MKFKFSKHFSRKGMIIIILVMSVGTASFFTASKFFDERAAEYKIATTNAKGFRAFLLARAGMQGGLGALKKIPEEALYQSGIAFNPPPVPLGGGMIYYKIIPEDGKININYLVKTYDQQPNLRVMEMIQKLYEQLGIPKEKIFAVVDWIDENNDETGGGAEIAYYSSLNPPRKIKNAPLYNLSELTSIKGYDRALVYESLKPADYDKNNSQDFLSDEEKILVTDSDFILSNNITAYLPYKDTSDERININAAPFYVLMSLSEFMTRAAAMRLLKFKIERGGYVKELKDLEKFAEFQVKTASGFTLYNELAGDGTSISGGRVKTKGEIFKIIGVGKVGSTVRRVTSLFDLTNDQILFYSED
ncbi:MAG: general secretion pathway protein GspK [Leptospiraceae bacterium]|nr:general secretion pathway protein GspK [Leptospiraceae bacterium]MCP5511380.1 general secretion pathway protein GspK [Leptospiraceae bacterium]